MGSISCVDINFNFDLFRITFKALVQIQCIFIDTNHAFSCFRLDTHCYTCGLHSATSRSDHKTFRLLVRKTAIFQITRGLNGCQDVLLWYWRASGDFWGCHLCLSLKKFSTKATMHWRQLTIFASTGGSAKKTVFLGQARSDTPNLRFGGNHWIFTDNKNYLS